MPCYHKYKEKAIDWVNEQKKIGYRCIIVSEKDYQKWGSDLDKLITFPWKLVHKNWTKTLLIIGEK